MYKPGVICQGSLCDYEKQNKNNLKSTYCLKQLKFVWLYGQPKNTAFAYKSNNLVQLLSIITES